MSKTRLVKPEDQHLPTMEPPPVPPVLDKAMKRLAQRIEELNQLNQANADDKAIALDAMTKAQIPAITRHGIELVHTTTDKLRVRLVDDDSGADDAE